jgi:glycosyltransferase involved in cell wall biosynthesis
MYSYGGELIKISLPFSKTNRENGFLKRTIRFFNLIKQVKKIKKSKKIDVTISFLEGSNFVNVLSRKNDQVILSTRSYLSGEFADNARLRIFRPLIRKLYNRANKIVVPSEVIKNDLAKNFGVNENKISVVYNFIDKDFIASARTESLDPHLQKLLASRRILINVGRMTTAKGQWLLPSVLATVKKTIDNVALIILGEGPMEQKIISNAAKEHLRVYKKGETITGGEEYDIFLVGFDKNPFRYFAASEIFIKSSVYEGFPNVIVEAMSCGLPVVSTDCTSGPREIISPSSVMGTSATSLEYAEFGLLCPALNKEPDEQKAYISCASRAVIELLTADEKRNHYHHQSLKRAKDFEKDRILTQWINLIETK